MKIYNIFYLIILILTGWSCNRDDEFAPYQKIHQFSILPFEEKSIELVQYERLQIEPDVSGLDKEKHYSYEWRLYEGTSFIILSTEKNLDVAVELNIGTYTFHLLIEEQDSRIKAIGELLTLKVTGAFPEGWLVGNNLNGTKGQLSFIRTRDDQVFINPIEDINQTVYSEKLIATISGVIPNPYYKGFHQLFYFTDQGLRVFDAETMLLASDLNEYFHQPMRFKQIPAYGANHFNQDQYLIENGNLYAADGLNFGFNRDYGTFSDRFEGDYSLFPFVFKDKQITTYFYDNKNKRFLAAPYSSRSLNTSSAETNNGQYNINNIKRTMLASDSTLSNNYLSLMYDDSGYYIYAFRLSDRKAIGGGYYTELKQSPEIKQLTAFAAAGNVERAYYSSKNKIYKIGAASGNVSLLYEFAPGLEIIDMKMLKTGKDANRQLTVAVNSGHEGEVHCIYLDDFGDFDSSQNIKKYTGFGQITNINYRLPL